MNLTAEIPVKSYIRTYLENNYGTPAAITRSDAIGRYLYQLLEHDRCHQDTKYSGYNEVVTVLITEDIHLRKGCFLTKTNVVNFNRVVEEQIKGLMYTFLDAMLDADPKIKINEGIERYQERYGFSENDFSFEAIKKAYYRHRRKLLENRRSNALKMSA